MRPRTKALKVALSKAGAGFFGLMLLLSNAFPLSGATFTNNASIQVTTDSTSSLTSTSGVFTVSCWFRISIPSSLTLSDNMDILMDRSDGNESANFSYLVRYNVANNAVEFTTHGSSSNYSKTLIQSPYLNRWYHVAVSRSSSVFSAYVDGRPFSAEAMTVGSTVGSGLAIGGISGTSKQFYGDIVEVAVYSTALSQTLIEDRMFKDQRTFPNLKGYYKLGYSTNASDYYHNFVTSPPTGTDPATPSGSGTVTFSQVDQAGEQSLFDANLNHGENALTPLSGAFAWSQTAFARPVPGIAFDFEFGYSSALPTQPSTDDSSDPYDQRTLGPKWRQTFDTRIVDGITQNELDVVKWDGSTEAWTRSNLFATLSTKHHEYRGELVQLGNTAEVQWTTPERLVYLFRDPGDASGMAGRLEQISDFNSNVVQLQWDEDALVVTNVTDTAGGSYAFNYDFSKYLLTNVTYGAWQVNFTYDSTNHLISKTLTNTSGLYTAVNTTWQFQYDTNGLLARIIDPRGDTNLVVQYDQYGRQTNELDALGRATRTEYGTPGPWQIRHTDPATNSWVETYDPKGHILAQQDPLTNITSYTYDTNGNRTSITEPLGWQTFFGYDNRANVVAKTNALGEVTQWVFHSFFNKAIQQITPQPADTNGFTTWTNFYAYDSGGNLTNHSDALGSLVRYSYLTNGLVSTATDANGNVTRFAYDTNGFLISRTDPATNTTTYTVNDVGWKLQEVDALGDPTSYTYNLNGNPTRIQDVLGRVFNKVYDPNGNLLSSTDGKGQTTSYAYDLANQKTNMVDRTGTNKWTYFYTSRGKLDHVTDPLTNSVVNNYDAANRITQVTDPLGHSVTNQYDANGNEISFFDKTGQRWTKTYDRLNRVITETDPLGDSKATTYDLAGRVQQLTSPNGYPSTHTYDGRGRLTKWVDPMNFPWVYSYDGVGNITNITDALGGHYIMAYGSRNERTLEKNQDGFVWQYAYDELLRLTQQTDPNGTVRTPTYDSAGRVLFVIFSTGRRDSFAYDPNDNPQTISRRYSGVTTATQFIYDALDRVTEQDDALGKTVLYGYDPLGRVTAITYPGGKTLTNIYDPLGRLTAQTDWAGRQMAYVYDLADRLVSRTYPNGVVQTNTFDSAGRITGLNCSATTVNSNSINVALAYAYDRNGNKTGSSESGTFNWPQPSLTDEQSSFTPAGRLITRQIQNNSATSNQLSSIAYHYDASGNMTNAAGNGQSWTLAYDEDNRTTSIQWDAGITSKNITNRYDALGRRISKNVDGVTTGYVLSLVGGMEKVLCDLDGNGNVTAWYVHGPDLCYRVDGTNGLLCYHADAQANIVALTDGNTNLVAQYAYTAYGRSLGSTNVPSQISNPYLFVGILGVMEESDIPDLYFMRARYYSADAGEFLSTDPVKNFGSGWKPISYIYADSNPAMHTDPSGMWSPGFGDVYTVGKHIYEIYNGQVSGVTVLEYGFSDGFQLGVDLSVTAFGTPAMLAGLAVADAIGNVSTAIEIAGDVASGVRSGTGFPAEFGKAVAGAYMGAVSAIGNGIGALAGGFANQGSYSTTFTSPTAGTTPMIASSLSKVSSANQSVTSRTVAAGTAANKMNSAGNTGGARPTGGSVPTSGSGGAIGVNTYTVRPGDTLGNIAYANGTSATALGAANGIRNVNLIYPGQVITIPHR